MVSASVPNSHNQHQKKCVEVIKENSDLHLGSDAKNETKYCDIVPLIKRGLIRDLIMVFKTGLATVNLCYLKQSSCV